MSMEEYQMLSDRELQRYDGKLLENKLLMLDGLNSTMEEIEVERKTTCVDCRKECKAL
jgi:hypothetical protein